MWKVYVPEYSRNPQAAVIITKFLPSSGCNQLSSVKRRVCHRSWWTVPGNVLSTTSSDSCFYTRYMLFFCTCKDWPLLHDRILHCRSLILDRTTHSKLIWSTQTISWPDHPLTCPSFIIISATIQEDVTSSSWQMQVNIRHFGFHLDSSFHWLNGSCQLNITGV